MNRLSRKPIHIFWEPSSGYGATYWTPTRITHIIAIALCAISGITLMYSASFEHSTALDIVGAVIGVIGIALGCVRVKVSGTKNADAVSNRVESNFRERKITEIYSAMRNSCEQVFDLDKNIERPDNWQQENEYIETMYAALACGQDNIALYSVKRLKSIVMADMYDKDEFEHYCQQLEQQKERLASLCKIWSSPLVLDGVKISLNNRNMGTLVEKMSAIGTKIGADVMVEGYIAGVPLNDILA